MASRALAGFIGGFADTAKAGLERRQMEEAERKKAEMLAALRLKTDKEMELFRNAEDAKKPNKDNTSIDAARGVKIVRDSNGNVLREVPLTGNELETYRLSLEDARLDVENTRSTIASRAATDARQERSTNAYIRSLDRVGKDDEITPMSNSEAAKELLYQNDALVIAATENGDLSRNEIEELAYHVMRNAKGATPAAADDDANRRFRMALRHMQAARAAR